MIGDLRGLAPRTGRHSCGSSLTSREATRGEPMTCCYSLTMPSRTGQPWLGSASGRSASER